MKNNKGFSLVELIIVIAIMAILVGVMAPQLIKYIEKTNVSSDVQLCDSIRTALTTAAMDPDLVKDGSVKAVASEILGVSLDNAKSQLKSKSAKGKDIYYKKSGNQIKVYVNGFESSIYSGN